MKAIDLSRLDLFTMPNADIKGSDSRTIYQMVEETDTGIIAEGVLATNYGSLGLKFYLPDYTEVIHIPLESL